MSFCPPIHLHHPHLPRGAALSPFAITLKRLTCAYLLPGGCSGSGQPTVRSTFFFLPRSRLTRLAFFPAHEGGRQGGGRRCRAFRTRAWHCLEPERSECAEKNWIKKQQNWRFFRMGDGTGLFNTDSGCTFFRGLRSVCGPPSTPQPPVVPSDPRPKSSEGV